MSISAVTSAVTAPSQNTPAAFAQEATESAATTLKEAQAGDVVAQRKLAAQKALLQLQPQAVPSPASEPGKGGIVDHAA
jgi:hypothetical protein